MYFTAFVSGIRFDYAKNSKKSGVGHYTFVHYIRTYYQQDI